MDKKEFESLISAIKKIYPRDVMKNEIANARQNSEVFHYPNDPRMRIAGDDDDPEVLKGKNPQEVRKSAQREAFSGLMADTQILKSLKNCKYGDKSANLIDGIDSLELTDEQKVQLDDTLKGWGIEYYRAFDKEVADFSASVSKDFNLDRYFTAFCENERIVKGTDQVYAFAKKRMDQEDTRDLFDYVKAGDLSAVKKFVDEHANIDLSKVGVEGMTLLQTAVMNGKSTVAEYLVSEKGVDTTVKNEDGETAADLAQKYQKASKVFKKLFDLQEQHATDDKKPADDKEVKDDNKPADDKEVKDDKKTADDKKSSEKELTLPEFLQTRVDLKSVNREIAQAEKGADTTALVAKQEELKALIDANKDRLLSLHDRRELGYGTLDFSAVPDEELVNRYALLGSYFKTREEQDALGAKYDAMFENGKDPTSKENVQEFLKIQGSMLRLDEERLSALKQIQETNALAEPNTDTANAVAEQLDQTITSVSNTVDEYSQIATPALNQANTLWGTVRNTTGVKGVVDTASDIYDGIADTLKPLKDLYNQGAESAGHQWDLAQERTLLPDMQAVQTALEAEMKERDPEKLRKTIESVRVAEKAVSQTKEAELRGDNPQKESAVAYELANRKIETLDNYVAKNPSKTLEKAEDNKKEPQQAETQAKEEVKKEAKEEGKEEAKEEKTDNAKAVKAGSLSQETAEKILKLEEEINATQNEREKLEKYKTVHEMIKAEYQKQRQTALSNNDAETVALLDEKIKASGDSINKIQDALDHMPNQPQSTVDTEKTPPKDGKQTTPGHTSGGKRPANSGTPGTPGTPVIPGVSGIPGGNPGKSEEEKVKEQEAARAAMAVAEAENGGEENTPWWQSKWLWIALSAVSLGVLGFFAFRKGGWLNKAKKTTTSVSTTIGTVTDEIGALSPAATKSLAMVNTASEQTNNGISAVLEGVAQAVPAVLDTPKQTNSNSR